MPFGTRVRTNYDCGVTEEILDYVKEIASSTSSETNISNIIESLSKIVNLLGDNAGEGSTMYDIVSNIEGDTTNIANAITPNGSLYSLVNSVNTHAGSMDTAVTSILNSMKSADAAKKNDCMYMYGGASIGIRSYVTDSPSDSDSTYYLPNVLTYNVGILGKSATLTRIESISMLNSSASSFTFPTTSTSNVYLIARVPNEIGLISTCANVVPVAISIVQNSNGNNVLVSGTVYGYVSLHNENGGYTIVIPAGTYYENGGTDSNIASSVLYYEDLEICQYAPGEDGAIKSDYAAIRITGNGITIAVSESTSEPSGYLVTVNTNGSTINVVTHQKSS